MSDNGLRIDDLRTAFFSKVVRTSLSQRNLHDDDIEILAVERIPFSSVEGVVSRLSAVTDERLVGLILMKVRYKIAGSEHLRQFMVKSKVSGSEVRSRLIEVQARLDARLVDRQRALNPSIVDNCHLRELALFREHEKHLRPVTPATFHVWEDQPKQIFVMVMEYLQDVQHLSTIDHLDSWTIDDISAVVSDIAIVHGAFLSKAHLLERCYIEPFERLYNGNFLAYQREQLRYCAESCPDLFDNRRVAVLNDLQNATEKRRREIGSMPLTLIHGDLTPRNLCLKKYENITRPFQLCAYDWELAQLHLAQRDVVEFLCYVLDPQLQWDTGVVTSLLELHRQSLESHAKVPISQEIYMRGMELSLYEFACWKLLVQGVSHRLLKKRDYFVRLIENTFNAIEYFARDEA